MSGPWLISGYFLMRAMCSRDEEMIMKRFKCLMVGFTLGTLALPVLAGVPRVLQPQGQYVLARSLAQPVLLEEIAGAAGVDDALVAVQLQPRVERARAAVVLHLPLQVRAAADRVAQLRFLRDADGALL